MTDLRTAAQQALEALGELKQRGLYGDFEGVTDTLRAALAEPAAPTAVEPEPVAAISKWSLREVYFGEAGEPLMHRSPPQRKPLTDERKAFEAWAAARGWPHSWTTSDGVRQFAVASWDVWCAALSAPAAPTVVEPYPAAWMCWTHGGAYLAHSAENNAGIAPIPLYPHPPRAAEPDVPEISCGNMEPVAWAVDTPQGYEFCAWQEDAWAACRGGQSPEPLYRFAHPPRTALTDEQIDDCLPLGMAPYSTLVGPDEIRRFARAIEAALAGKAVTP